MPSIQIVVHHVMYLFDLVDKYSRSVTTCFKSDFITDRCWSGILEKKVEIVWSALLSNESGERERANI